MAVFAEDYNVAGPVDGYHQTEVSGKEAIENYDVTCE